ncbi:hypothetical protein ACN38_g12648 [Penicillium nordicum]|uniref:Uncharacterized protein n=1 Tax=Penicillium nordicum TaxID=229535 RepID=A0A0M8NY71_9EURO|nr:hypothetical protein ACN38_g12648 [Penicillium nordicum]
MISLAQNLGSAKLILPALQGIHVEPHPGVDLSIAHKWAQAMGLVFKAQPNPQPINGHPSKPIKSPFLYINAVLVRIK